MRLLKLQFLSVRQLLLLLVFFVTGSVVAQNSPIKGHVQDASGTPMIGVNVLIKGTTTGVITDLDGNFALSASSTDTIHVSYISYVPQDIVVGNKKEINVTLQENVEELEELVVIGYGAEKKSDATGSMEQITSEDMNSGLISSPEQMMNGKVPGVQMSPNGGQPGAATSVRIRGVNSISASSEPLYVIDGVPIDNNRTGMETSGDLGVNSTSMNPLSMIAPSDIESMTVLKDASATAIYGSRGANGVIIINTKSGKEGKTSLTYDGYVSFSSPSNKIDVLSADEYRAAVNDPNKTGTASTDWQDEIFQTGVSQNHNVAFSGGTKNFNYRASAGYLYQEGTVIGSDLERINARINLQQKMFDDKMTIRFNMNNSNYKTNNLPEQQTGGFQGGVINNALKMDPTQPVYNEDGTYNEYSQDVRNPVAMANQIDDITEGNRLITNLETEYKIIPSLSAKLNLGMDYDNQSRKIYQPIASSVGGDVDGRAIRENSQYSNKLLEFYLTYDKDLGEKSHLNVLGGYSWQQFDTDIHNTIATGFNNDNLGYDNISARNQESKAFHETYRMISFFGRVNYSYDNRYLFTATVRQDGSSRFGGNNQWGVFPSAALAWKVINEDFMQGQETLTDAKIRLGYGITGNQNIGNYRYMSTINVEQNGGYFFGDDYYMRYISTTNPNQDLQWEQTAQFNAGIDFGFMKNKLTGSVDYYNKNTTNLLLEVPAVQPSVSSWYLDNVGAMTNKGVELNLNYSAIDKEDLSLSFNFNMAYNKNEVTELYNNADIYTGTVSGAGANGFIQVVQEGQPIGAFNGYVYEGTDEFGNEIFKDVNGDGEITEDDKQVVGQALPDFTYGFSTNLKYKQWDFSMVWRAQTGNQVYNNTAAELSQPSRIPGQNTNETGATGYQVGASNYEYLSSRWVEDASFLKLDNITVGYTFDGSNTKAFKGARLYVTAQNLVTFTNYSGYDPEVNTTAGNSAAQAYGIDYTSYPQSRTFLVGFNLNF